MQDKSPRNLPPKELKQWLVNESLSPILIDVREKEELNIASMQLPVMHLPLSESSKWIETFSKHLSFDRPIVVLCHAGIRSWKFCIWLLEQDERYNVWNLEGGIDAWSQDVDPSIPRY